MIDYQPEDNAEERFAEDIAQMLGERGSISERFCAPFLPRQKNAPRPGLSHLLRKAMIWPRA